MDKIHAVKSKGDLALASGDYLQACKYYTEGLDLLAPSFNIYQDKFVGAKVSNHHILDNFHLESSFYSKRSVAFLKRKKYYYAHEDAKQMVNIRPMWFKGYFRMANIEYECGLYEDAMKNYQLALQYVRQEKVELRDRYGMHIDQSIKHVLFMMKRECGFDYQIPWIGAAFGLVVGMAGIAYDYISHGTKAYISHPLLKLTVIGLLSFIFFYLAGLQRLYSRKQKEKLIKSPYNMK